MMNSMMTKIMVENWKEKDVDCQMLMNVEMKRSNDDHEHSLHLIVNPTFDEIVVRTYALLMHLNHSDRLSEEELEYLSVDSDALDKNLNISRRDDG